MTAPEICIWAFFGLCWLGIGLVILRRLRADLGAWAMDKKPYNT